MAQNEEKRLLDIKKRFGRKGMLALIGLIAGVLLLLIPTSKEEPTPTDGVGRGSSTEYCAELEEKAESLICSLSGVDECNVFITLESGFSYSYASDMRISDTGNGKTTEKTIVLAGNGNGEEGILLTESMPRVAGVAVVCRGASYETQYRIIELMMALFDIKSNRISVQT